jgi:hypothetical protein
MATLEWFNNGNSVYYNDSNMPSQYVVSYNSSDIVTYYNNPGRIYVHYSGSFQIGNDVRGSCNYISFYDSTGRLSLKVTLDTNTQDAYTIYNFVIRSNASGLTNYIYQNNDTINLSENNDRLASGNGAGTGDDTIFAKGGADYILAGSGNDYVDGGSGDDHLDGMDGNDTLIGGTGADGMYGRRGDDTYYVDNTGDQVYEYYGQGTDTVYSSVSYTIGSYVENLTLTGSGSYDATGNSSANTLIGNSGANSLYGYGGNDYLSGGAGNDTLDGGSGSDTMVGGAGNDIYKVENSSDSVIESSDGGTDTVYTTISYTLGSNIENLVLESGYTINGTGNGSDNTLTGNSAANTLTGGAGNDILVSGGGSDFLSGGSGDDFALLSMAHRSATSVSSTRVTDSSQTVTMDSVEGKAFLDVELSGSFQSGALNCVDTTGDGRVDIIMETDSHQFYFASGSGSGSTGGLSTASVGLTHGGASGFIENQVQFYDVNGDGRYDSIFQGLDNRFWANFGTDSGFSGATLVGQHGGAFNTAQVQYADTNGDSKIDMIFQGTDNRFWVSTGEASGFSGASLAAEHGGPFNPDQVQYTDMNGDSKTDLIFQGTDNRFWANFGADSGFGGARLVAEHGGPFTAGQVQYADVNGDSKSDLIFQGVDNRFWVQLGQDNSFGGATLAATVTHDDFNINQWQLVDMNGDNAKDLMYQGDGNDVWYYLSNGDGTFASGQKVASFGGSFQRESIGYGDLNGDGLGDIIFQDANNDIWTSLQNHDWIT